MNSQTIYSWPLVSAIMGEVYASRGFSVNWSAINCTWASTINGSGVADYFNRSIEERENFALNHTAADDNITRTFASRTNQQYVIAGRTLLANTCYTINTYVNDTAQSSTDFFEEIVAFDGGPRSNVGNVVYVTRIEQDRFGYMNTTTYDFQILIPENGLDGFSYSTGYYFYVELG
jgi:hypothetical protein